MIVGEIASTTVTVAAHVLVFPIPSVTVNVTVLAPKSLQLNVLGVET